MIPWWLRKRRKLDRSVTLQISFEVFEVLLCRGLSVMGNSWEYGKLLLRICHNDFRICRTHTDILIFIIVWRHWLHDWSSLFVWLPHKLPWFEKIHNSVFVSSKIYIQRMKHYLSKKRNQAWWKFWALIIGTVPTAGLSLKNCKKLLHTTRKHISK